MTPKTKDQLHVGEPEPKQKHAPELWIYNTITKRKEIFTPLEPEIVRMYTCGLTVNYVMHIGHARTYIFWDVVERFLQHIGYNVKHVSNVTDISVDDNILKRVKTSGEAFQQLVTRYTLDYYQDRHSLGIKDPYTYVIATQHIQEMIEFIEELCNEDFAYETEDGVYFRINTFPRYGRLAGIKTSSLKAGAGGRIDKDQYDKEAVGDFVLWKRAKPDEPFWHSPWGPGRPGWHIECSAMARKYLGATIDISGGGEDNIFPHHENSIAQSEAANDKPYVRYWMHVRHLQWDGEKMSKSLGNILSVREAVTKFGAAPLRLALLRLHYRKPLVFKEEEVQRDHKQLMKLQQLITRLHFLTTARTKSKQDDVVLAQAMQNAKKQFEMALLDDFNTGRAINHLFQFVNQVQSRMEAKQLMGKAIATKLLNFFDALTPILLGDLYFKIIRVKPNTQVTKLVERLLNERNRLRKEKQYEQADVIRKTLKQVGIEIADTAEGTEWWTTSIKPQNTK